MSTRESEIAANLAAVRARIAAACVASDRGPDEVRLVAVTKTWPPEDIDILADLGVRDVGENRDQDAAAKAVLRPDLRWHFLGGIQTNKARRIATYASVVHSLDRDVLVPQLSKGATEAGRTLDVLIQVSIDGDPNRGGAQAADVVALADAAAEAEALRPAGVMAVAPLDWEPARAFELLSQVSMRLVAAHPGATEVSAGMSGDLETAIAHGSTMVRVGGALFGVRKPDVR